MFVRTGIGFACGFDVLDELARIDCPTLVCVGELDPITPVAAAREIVNALPDESTQFEVIEGAGHFRASMNYDSPNPVSAAQLFFAGCLALAAISAFVLWDKWWPAGFHNSVVPFYFSWSFAALGLASGIVSIVLAAIRSYWLLAAFCVIGTLGNGLLTLVHWAIWAMGQSAWH